MLLRYDSHTMKLCSKPSALIYTCMEKVEIGIYLYILNYSLSPAVLVLATLLLD
jgi:hypothetical protein